MYLNFFICKREMSFISEGPYNDHIYDNGLTKRPALTGTVLHILVTMVIPNMSEKWKTKSNMMHRSKSELWVKELMKLNSYPLLESLPLEVHVNALNICVQKNVLVPIPGKKITEFCGIFQEAYSLKELRTMDIISMSVYLQIHMSSSSYVFRFICLQIHNLQSDFRR